MLPLKQKHAKYGGTATEYNIYLYSAKEKRKEKKYVSVNNLLIIKITHSFMGFETDTYSYDSLLVKLQGT